MTLNTFILPIGILLASLFYQPVVAQTATATVNTVSTVNIPASPTIETIDIVENGKSGIKVLMPAANPSVVNKNWKKFLKNCKGKTRLGKEGYFTDNASIPKISENVIDVYSKIDKYPEGTILKVFFDLGGAYLNKTTHAEQHKAATQMLHDFGANESIAALKMSLVVEEKKMLAIRDERKRLKDNNDKILKQIATAKEAVIRSELMLRENQGLQEKQDQEAQIQINKVEQLKSNISNISLQK